MRHVTYCALRLGDNLAHAHFLRSLAIAYPREEFVHYLHDNYAAEVRQVVADLENIKIKVLSLICTDWWNEKPYEPALNAWKNTGGFWERHKLRLDYGSFMLAWFEHLAGQMGLFSPLLIIPQLLFDYPNLRYPYKLPRRHHALVVNSSPMSGQAPDYSIAQMDMLILALSYKFEKVYITEEREALAKIANVRATPLNHFSVTDIGRLSQACEVVILVSTGPSWTSFNIWNEANPPRFLGLINGNETVNLSRHTQHAHSVPAMHAKLLNQGIL